MCPLTVRKCSVTNTFGKFSSWTKLQWYDPDPDRKNESNIFLEKGTNLAHKFATKLNYIGRKRDHVTTLNWKDK